MINTKFLLISLGSIALVYIVIFLMLSNIWEPEDQQEFRASNVEKNEETTTSRERPFVAEGFRGYEWGSNLSKMKEELNLSYLGPSVAIRQIDEYNLDLRLLGGAVIDSCKLSFYKERFCGAYVLSKTCGDADVLYRSTLVAYGQPDEEPDGRGVLKLATWYTEETVRVFSLDYVDCVGKLILLSKRIMEETAEDEKAAVEKAKKDF